MILKKLNKIFKRKDSSYNYKEDKWQLVPKINEEDFDSIYYDLIKFRIKDEFVNQILEDGFKYSKQFMERYNLKDYIELLNYQLNTNIEKIIDVDDFKKFLSYSNYYINSTEAIRLTIRNLIRTCFDVIIDLNIKISFFNENNEYFKRFSPFNDIFSFEYFVTEEITKRIKISQSFCGSIRFGLVDFNSILTEYFLLHCVKVRENFHELHENRELIISEINRVKLIYKKHKCFDFLKNYVNELEEILHDFDRGFHISEFNKLEYSNSVSSLKEEKVKLYNKLTTEQVQEITIFFQNWFKVNSGYDEQFKSNIREFLNLKFDKIKNELILKKTVKSFSLFFYFLFKKEYYTREEVDLLFESQKIKPIKGTLFNKEVLSKYFCQFEKGNSIKNDKEIKNINEFFRSF